MRYLINDTYWNKDSGPILFYTGNEGDIKMFAENTASISYFSVFSIPSDIFVIFQGFMCRDIAPEMKAMIIFAEHRFYGESMPFGNTSYSVSINNFRINNSSEKKKT